MWKWIAVLAAVVSFGGILYIFKKYNQNIEDDPYYLYGDSLYKPEAVSAGTPSSKPTESPDDVQVNFDGSDEVSSMVH